MPLLYGQTLHNLIWRSKFQPEAIPISLLDEGNSFNNLLRRCNDIKIIYNAATFKLIKMSPATHQCFCIHKAYSNVPTFNF